MPLPLLAPVVAVAATLTLKSDTKPVKVYVKTPRGTIYWGGAGLDGDYLKPQVAAFQQVGIKNVYVGLTNTGGADLPEALKLGGTLVDAIRAGIAIRYKDDSGEWVLTAGMDAAEGQFNLIGYSYGSLLAAQTANFYAKRGHIVHNLVLIGSPIDADFLKSLRSNPNIKQVVVIDLTDKGDPLHAGMTQLDMVNASPALGKQFFAGQGEGHFYYAHVVQDSPARWKDLAQRIFNAGIR